jgi:hypothetical protein
VSSVNDSEAEVRVYRVEMPVHSNDYIALSWEDVCAFLEGECEPFDADAPETVGDGDTGIRITAEHWTRERLNSLGEWSP